MTDQPSQVDMINAALAKAREAAAAAPAVNPQLPVAANGNVPAPVQGGRAVSMREMVQESGMRPDAYLKVTPFGFNVGKDTKTIFDEIAVEFRLDAARPFYGLRYGNPAKYERSYDRVVNSRSKRSWADCVAEAARLDPRCTGDYPALDLPFTVTEEIKSKSGEVLLAAGKTLGWTSSVTNWSAWQAFIEPLYTLIDAGLIPANAKVAGKIKHEQKSGNGNNWGALLLDDVIVVDLAPPAEDQAQAA